jgi:hypothetical protein
LSRTPHEQCREREALLTLPESKSTSRAKGARRNLGDPVSGRHLMTPAVRIGEVRNRKPMMHGSGKSDEAIVAVKRPNEAERSAEEAVERRAEAKGNARRPSADRMQSRGAVPQGPERIRQASIAVLHPRWEPYAGKPHVRFCAGGAQQ